MARNKSSTCQNPFQLCTKFSSIKIHELLCIPPSHVAYIALGSEEAHFKQKLQEVEESFVRKKNKLEQTKLRFFHFLILEFKYLLDYITIHTNYLTSPKAV